MHSRIEEATKQYTLALERLPEETLTRLQLEIEHQQRVQGFLYYGVLGAPGVPHPIALTPLLLPRSIVPTCHALARAVARFQSRVPELWLRDEPDIQKILPLHPRTAQWMARYHRPRPDPDDLFIRLDIAVRAHPGSGELLPVLFENNSLALAGLLNHTVGTELLSQYVLPKLGAELPPFVPGPNLIDLACNWIKRRKLQNGTLFILDDPKFLDNGSEFRYLKHAFRNRGIAAIHGHLPDLTIKDHYIFAGDLPVALVWRDLAYQEIRLPNRHEDARAFFQLLEGGQMLHGFASEFVEKGLLECLTNPQYQSLFSLEEWRLLKKCVPWTRVLWQRTTTDGNGQPIDLFAYALQHQRELVIKPNRDFGGHGILLGAEINEYQWRQALERASREPSQWVIQEFVEVQPQPMIFLQEGRVRSGPCFPTVGLFYAHDTLGLHGRIGLGKVVNVAQGGALACVFLLE